MPFPVCCEFRTAVVRFFQENHATIGPIVAKWHEIAGMARMWNLPRSLSHDETYETTSAHGSDSSCSAMTGATLDKNCVLEQTPKRHFKCSFCGHSTPMCDSGMF